MEDKYNSNIINVKDMILNKVKVAYYYFMKKKWNIGFAELASCNELLKCERWNIKWMKHQYTDRWFVDSFILKVTCNVIELLVEEKCDKINQAIISKLLIDHKSYILKSCKVILATNSHLSSMLWTSVFSIRNFIIAKL